MKLWLDAQLPPGLAGWIEAKFRLPARAVRDLGLRDAEDEEIFRAARAADAIVITKDSDFLVLLERYGPPPRVVWVRCGNTTNAYLREIFSNRLALALALLQEGEHIVEIRD
jgi:predicted nuclease of predicted toxin-antitoxin system